MKDSLLAAARRGLRHHLPVAAIVASLGVLAPLAPANLSHAQTAGSLFPPTELDQELKGPGAGGVREELPPTIAKPRPTRPPHPHKPETAEPAGQSIEEIPAPGADPLPHNGLNPPLTQPQHPLAPPANHGGELIQPGQPEPVEGELAPGGELVLPEISPLQPPANSTPNTGATLPPANVTAGWAAAASQPLLPSCQPVNVTLEQLIDRMLRISPVLQAAAHRSRMMQLGHVTAGGFYGGAPAVVAAPQLRRWGCANCFPPCGGGPCAGGCNAGNCAAGNCAACVGGFRGNTGCLGGCGVACGCGVAPAAPAAVAVMDAGQARYEFRVAVENQIQAVVRAYWTLSLQRGLLVQRRKLHNNALAVLQNSGDHSPAAASWKEDLCNAETNVFNAQDQLVRIVGDLHLLSGGVELIPTSAAPAVCQAPDVEKTISVAIARRSRQETTPHHIIAQQVRMSTREVAVATAAINTCQAACESANLNCRQIERDAFAGLHGPEQLVAAHRRIASEEAALLVAQTRHAIALAGVQRSLGLLSEIYTQPRR